MHLFNADTWNRFLSENPVDVNDLSDDGFRDWLQARIAERANDPVFQQKCRIRDLRHSHFTELETLREEWQAAGNACDGDARRREIERLDHEIDRLRKAVRGLRAAVQEQRASPAKLAWFESELAEKECLRNGWIEESPEWRRWQKAMVRLQEFQERIGFNEAQRELERLRLARGRRSGQAGDQFEMDARQAISDWFASFSYRRPDEAGFEFARLDHVTLGCPRGEFDHLIVAWHPRFDHVVVKAVFESKRNINDLASGFRMRQENLAWFTNDDRGFDPAKYRSAQYPNGRFDRPAVHFQHGREFVFTPNSFRRLVRPHGSPFVIDDLFFITRPKPLVGVSSRELATILHAVAVDRDFRPDDPVSLQRFRRRYRPHSVQSRQVLGAYLAAGRAHQILLLD